MGYKLTAKPFFSKHQVSYSGSAAAAGFTFATDEVAVFIGSNVIATKRWLEIKNNVWDMFHAAKDAGTPTIVNQVAWWYRALNGAITKMDTTAAAIIGTRSEDDIVFGYGNNLRGGYKGESLTVHSSLSQIMKYLDERFKTI